jgi:hypothetical protein
MEQPTRNHVCKDERRHVYGLDLPDLLKTSEKLPDFKNRCFCGEKIEVDDLAGVSFFGADLRDTQWKPEINLQYAVFTNANLSGAKMPGAKLNNAKFSEANLTDASLWNADLSDADMRNCRLVNVDLEKAILDRTVLEGSDFGGEIRQERQKRYADALTMYRMLKSKFREMDEYDSVSWAYFHEREVLRKMISPRNMYKYHPPRESDQKNQFTKAQYITKNFLRFTISTLQSWSSGYGQKPLRAFFVGLIMIPVFAVTYFLIDGLGALRPLTPVDYLLFSVSTVLKSDTGGVQPASNLAQLLASVEAAIGLSLFAIFANALGQRAGKD